MKSKSFKIQELVPLSIVGLFHEDVLWNMIDDKLIKSIDKVKEVFPKGSIIVNNYLWSGDRNQSGIRTKNSKYYSEGSMHSVGKAVDMIFTAYTVDEVREYILANQQEFPLIGGLELASWLHVDVRSRRKGKIFMFDTNGIQVKYE